MKKIFIYVLGFVVGILVTAVPIAIKGYFFSDGDLVDVIKTSLILSSVTLALGFLGIMLMFFILAMMNKR